MLLDRLARTPADFRAEFPALEHTVHLASCSIGARSRALDQSMRRMLDVMTAGASAWSSFEAEVEDARRGFAALIGAAPEQVAVVPSASVGAYQAVSTLDLDRRPRVVTTAEEFPSIAHVWLAQRARGAEVVYADDTAPAAAGRPQVEHYRNAVDATTALVSVPLVTYNLGALLPVADVAQQAHAQGARVFVDAYQAIGVLPVDVDELGCDYLVAGAQKYLLGLPGVAFLYTREGAAGDLEPVLTGWFGRTDPFAFDPRLLDFPDTARRFETGTFAVPSLYATTAGLDLVAGLDLHEVRRHVSGLVGMAAERLGAQGEQVLMPSGPEGQGAHVGMVDDDPAALAARLGERGIAVSPRGRVVRLSFHFYNDERDVEALAQALAEMRGLTSTGPSDGSAVPAVQHAAVPERDAPPSGRAARDAVLAWVADPQPERFPFDAVLAAFLEVGKHVVDEGLLTALARARDLLGPLTSPQVEDDADLVRAFLSTALDKWDGRYDYPTYTALAVLPLPALADTSDRVAARQARDRLVLDLVADVVAFELDVIDGRTERLPEMRPDPRTVNKRLRLALRVAQPPLRRHGLAPKVTSDEPVAAARQLRVAVEAERTPRRDLELRLSVQPVYVAHDEHLFLRVLQLYEVTFSLLLAEVRAAIVAVREHRAVAAAEHVDCAEASLRESAPMFSLLGTMQIESFRTFRNFTEGASAIQSRSYKVLESLCRRPDEERLDSPAYHSVPEVREQVVAGPDTLDDAYEAARAGDAVPAEEMELLTAAMRRFAATLMRWRQSHYRLAVQMLGQRSGTGYTAGTPYLRAVRTIPVFRSIEETEGEPGDPAGGEPHGVEGDVVARSG